MELHAFAQLEGPDLGVGGVDFPFDGQPRDQLARPSADVGFPSDQWVINGVARELVGTSAAIWLARGQRYVGHRDAVANHAFGERRRRQQQRCDGQQRAQR